MAREKTIRIAKLLLCAWIAVSFQAPFAEASWAADEHRSPIRVLAPAASSPAIQIVRTNNRFDASKLRGSADSWFILPASAAWYAESVRRAFAPEIAQPGNALVRNLGGRSPPGQIS